MGVWVKSAEIGNHQNLYLAVEGSGRDTVSSASSILFPLSEFQLLFHPSHMSLLEKALALAVDAHRGQKDPAGKPYILHPLRVMARVQTEDEQVVAILHDVVEDTPWTPEKLAAEGFPPHILEALLRNSKSLALTSR